MNISTYNKTKGIYNRSALEIKNIFKKNLIKDYLKVIFGSTLTAAAFGFFILPLNFATAGVTGFAKILNNVIGLPLYQLVLIINIVIFCLGTVFLGKAFATKTLIAAFYFPYALKFFQSIAIFTSEFQYPIPMSLVAGVILGIGGGTIVRGNGSGCGNDVFALIINKYLPVSVGLVTNLIDVAIMLVQARDLPIENTIAGVLVCVVCAPVMNLVIYGSLSKAKAKRKFSVHKKAANVA